MDDMERQRAMLANDRHDRPRSSEAPPYVVYARTCKLPARRSGFLPEGKHVNLVMPGQTLDYREQGRNDSMLARPIHASRDDQCNFHPLVTLAILALSAGKLTLRRS
jgi:hypothetical protein